MEVYRLAKAEHGDTVVKMMSGEGARLHGGRWNAPGTRMVYAGSARSLCALEVVVAAYGVPLEAYYLAVIHLPDVLIERTSVLALPAGWDVIDIEAPASEDWGENWAAEERSVAAQVPSVLVPEEFNVLINPLHADFARIQVVTLDPYPLADRVNAKRDT